MPYERSKALVEHECWRAAATGQDVVVATCCAVVGGADFFPSRLGRTLCDYTTASLHAYVDGGFEFVAARDIVEGHLLCMHRGRSGEKYIFSSEYKTISEILDLYEEVSGTSATRVGGFRRQHDARFFGSGELLSEPVSPELSPAFHAWRHPPLEKTPSRRHPAKRDGSSAISQPVSALRFMRPTPFTTTATRSRIRSRNFRAMNAASTPWKTSMLPSQAYADNSREARRESGSRVRPPDFRGGRQSCVSKRAPRAWIRITGTRLKKCAESNRERWSRSFSGNVPLHYFGGQMARFTRSRIAVRIANSNSPWARCKAAGSCAPTMAGSMMKTGACADNPSRPLRPRGLPKLRSGPIP